MATASARPANRAKRPHPGRELTGTTVRSTAFVVSMVALLAGLAAIDYRAALITLGVLGTALSIYGEFRAHKLPPNTESKPTEFRSID